MSTITIEVPDKVADLINQAGDRLPEILELSLQQPVLSAHIYRYILDFLASQPSPEAMAAFAPTPEMITRLKTLLARQATGEITAAEEAELDEYERIEHLMILIKTGNLPFLKGEK